MTYYERIKTKLTAGLSPERLEIIDESAAHAGHNAEAATLGETHFRVRISARAFIGTTRIERHRRINALLADELASHVHALAIEADAPAG